jgi:DHA1 family tetracycline resistance protein-like MFS transporter
VDPPAPTSPFLLVTVFVDILGLGLIVPIAPRLITGLGGGGLSSGFLAYGLLGTSFGLLQFLCAPLLGSLSDRYGRRPSDDETYSRLFRAFDH